MDVQTRCNGKRLKIEVMLLLIANMKSYRPMLPPFAKQRMTSSDLECLKLTSFASRAISAVAELLVVIVKDKMATGVTRNFEWGRRDAEGVERVHGGGVWESGMPLPRKFLQFHP